MPLRATMSSFGPVLLAKVLGLNAVQESSLGLVFHYADTAGLPLLDLGVADPGFATVDVLPERVAEVRTMLPAAGHTRFAIDPTPRPVRPAPAPHVAPRPAAAPVRS